MTRRLLPWPDVRCAFYSIEEAVNFGEEARLAKKRGQRRRRSRTPRRLLEYQTVNILEQNSRDSHQSARRCPRQSCDVRRTALVQQLNLPSRASLEALQLSAICAPTSCNVNPILRTPTQQSSRQSSSQTHTDSKVLRELSCGPTRAFIAVFRQALDLPLLLRYDLLPQLSDHSLAFALTLETKRHYLSLLHQ
jgi:hypothetical protein